MLQYRSAAAPECLRELVDAHVRDQNATYGPLSSDREYFGFVFVFHGEIDSAVVEGRNCGNSSECSVDSGLAAPLIPSGAKVLGEWHTHPRLKGMSILSIDDVRGAHRNSHIRCYAAYYSQPDGDIYAWNPFLATVPTAMASLALIGNYRRKFPAGAYLAGAVDPASAAIRKTHLIRKAYKK